MTSDAVRIENITGAARASALPDIARLRVSVFRDYPYLYDGDLAYERGYLETYASAPDAVLVGAYDGDRLVGAATGALMSSQKDAWTEPFVQAGYPLDEVFYCGESVLEPAYRGRGIGHAFFDRREAAARRLGASLSCFCAVIRPDDHPDRPADYRPLDAFWRKRGYAQTPGAVARFNWREVGADVETPHELQFWSRTL